MRDSRKQREMAVTMVATGVPAIIGAFYVAPWLSKKLNVKVKK